MHPMYNTLTMEQAVTKYCAEFNRLYAVGTPVLLIWDYGEVTRTRTRTAAEVRHGIATIGLESESAYWRLDRVIPLPQEQDSTAGVVSFQIESALTDMLAELLRKDFNRLFNQFYDLLTQIAENVGDTLPAMPAGSAVHVSAHEALISLAEKYDPAIAEALVARLVKDSD